MYNSFYGLETGKTEKNFDKTFIYLLLLLFCMFLFVLNVLHCLLNIFRDAY